jgi:hypothetical protein
VNRPVYELRFNRKFFRGGNGGLHFIPGLNADIGADPFLKSGKYQISEQQKAFSAFEYLNNIELLPLLFIGKRLIPLFIQFYANTVGLLLVNALFDIINTFFGDVRRSKQDNFFII